MPTVFLSYSRTDLPLIEQLEAQLKSHHEISIWRDQEKIYGGQKWPKVLGEAIADQDVFLLAWSKHSAASHFVEFEWCTAIALKKTIVPCLLDDTPLASSLRTFHGYRLDDATGLIQSLRGAPLGDVQRREPVIESLKHITVMEEAAVLKQAKTIFTGQQWIVQGDVYQVAGDLHYHEAPSQPKREPVLRGRIFFVQDNDELMAADEVNVTLLQTAAKTFSDSDGLFTLPLPNTFQPGTKVEVGIKKDDWVISAPIDGEVTIPVLDSELVKIRLVKKGSPKLWSAERIEKFIQDMARKAKEQVRPEGKLQDVDFSRYIKDWALQYGFSAQQAKSEIDKWVAEVEQRDDPYHLGLAAYAKKNFGLAGMHFEESAGRKLKQMQEAEETVRKLKEEALRDYRLAGYARYNQYEFAQALLCYQQALQLVSQRDDQRLWAAILNDIGLTHGQLGMRAAGEWIHRHLAQAVEAYKAALTVRTKEQLPQDWAMTQNNLGTVLWNQGTRTSGEAGTKFLAEAVEAYRAALEIRTKEHLPEDWVQTHSNLAKAALSLEDWPTAAESYRNVLTLYPDYNEAYQASNAIYHEKLFAYQSAFEVAKQWLDRHPEDVSAQVNFAEVHLTTGRYEEATRRLGELRKKPDLSPNSVVGLRIVDIVTALALKKANTVPQKLQELRIFVSEQPETFHADWSFDGTKHYVEVEKVFIRYRTWLMDLFAVVKSKDRAALLAALDRVQASFKP